MQQPQRLVALRDIGHDDAEGHDVGELLERHVLLLHLAPDRIRRLLAAQHLRVEAAVLQALGQLGLDLGHDLVAFFLQVPKARLHGRAAVRIELGESKLFEFALHPLHADARGERRVEIHGLARDARAACRLLDVMERTHVVQAVGELHQQHADVGRHGEYQLAQVLGLLGALGLDFQPAELGDAIDQARDVFAEHARDLVTRGVGVLDRVVQQAGDDRRGVELHLGQDAGHFDGMREIRIARRTQLAAVLLQAIDIGTVERVLVRFRIVGLYTFNEFELTDHGNRPLYGDDCAFSTQNARIAELNPARARYSVTSSSSAIGRALGWAASAPP